MRRDSLLRGRRPLLILGVIAACATAAAAAAPAYAGPAPAKTAAAATSSSSAPSPRAPFSGRTVSGAVYGAAARTGNGAATADFLKLHKQMVARAHGTARASQLHDWWGSFPDTNSGTAVMATQSVSSTFRLSHAGDILYAPTMTPADNSCIEVVSVHSKTVAQVWAWDWCNAIAPGAKIGINASFLNKYTVTVNGRPAYTTEDVQTSATSNTWTAYLYNYQTKAWDTLFTSSGTDQSGLSYGWDMFEFYSATNKATGNTYVCGDLQTAGLTLESSSIQIEKNGTWTAANSTNSMWSPQAHPNPATYLCPNMQFNIIQNNSDWTVDVAS